MNETSDGQCTPAYLCTYAAPLLQQPCKGSAGLSWSLRRVQYMEVSSGGRINLDG